MKTEHADDGSICLSCYLLIYFMCVFGAIKQESLSLSEKYYQWPDLKQFYLSHISFFPLNPCEWRS